MALNIIGAFENEPPPLDFVIPGFLAGTVGCLALAIFNFEWLDVREQSILHRANLFTKSTGQKQPR